MEMIESGLVGPMDSRRGTARAEDAQGKPTKIHTYHPVYEYSKNKPARGLDLAAEISALDPELRVYHPARYYTNVLLLLVCVCVVICEIIFVIFK
jgi:hypothetical protein